MHILLKFLHRKQLIFKLNNIMHYTLCKNILSVSYSIYVTPQYMYVSTQTFVYYAVY